MKLSRHFTLEEFLRSDYAARRGIDMTPAADVVRRLERLTNEVLEAIRADVCTACKRDVPLRITSGYRPHELNALVGGSINSDHLYGRAADFYAPDLELDELAAIAKATCEALPVRQCIREFGSWLHVSIEEYGRIPTRQYLVASHEGGRTVYRDWV